MGVRTLPGGDTAKPYQLRGYATPQHRCGVSRQQLGRYVLSKPSEIAPGIRNLRRFQQHPLFAQLPHRGSKRRGRPVRGKPARGNRTTFEFILLHVEQPGVGAQRRPHHRHRRRIAQFNPVATGGRTTPDSSTVATTTATPKPTFRCRQLLLQ
uniref:(northern house mosquito) hypothetical protein n=1 Tax=Culex pipiens TaxID=7175 RepID=A0A8D8GRD0_CULPI